jgi:hypothetical protein
MRNMNCSALGANLPQGMSGRTLGFTVRSVESCSTRVESLVNSC